MIQNLTALFIKMFTMLSILNFLKSNYKIVLLALAAGFVVYSINLKIENRKLHRSIENQRENLKELEKKNGSLVFNKKDFKDYLKTSNSAEIKRVREVAKGNNIKLSEVKEAQVSKYHFIDTIFHDSIVPVYREVSILNDSQYSRPFTLTKECYEIEGFINSKDRNSTLLLSRVEFTDTLVNIVYEKKPKWFQFWKWFRRRKVERISVGKCGNIEFRNFKEENR